MPYSKTDVFNVVLSASVWNRCSALFT